MLAAKNGHEQSVEFFLRKKASQVATSSDNLNALEYCILGNHIECARRILYSDNWKDSMRNSRCLKGNDVETPMRLLLQEIPELARIVLNRSVTHETKGEKSGEIVCDFEFVEDLYRIEGWKPENIGRLDDDADSELKTIKVPYWGRNEGKKSGFLKNTSEMQTLSSACFKLSYKSASSAEVQPTLRFLAKVGCRLADTQVQLSLAKLAEYDGLFEVYFQPN